MFWWIVVLLLIVLFALAPLLIEFALGLQGKSSMVIPFFIFYTFPIAGVAFLIWAAALLWRVFG